MADVGRLEGGTRMSGCGRGRRKKSGKVLVSTGTSKSDKQSTGNDRSNDLGETWLLVSSVLHKQRDVLLFLFR
jgi:hypothetical protein